MLTVEDLKNSDAAWAFILLALMFGKTNKEEQRETGEKE